MPFLRLVISFKTTQNHIKGLMDNLVEMTYNQYLRTFMYA